MKSEVLAEDVWSDVMYLDDIAMEASRRGDGDAALRLHGLATTLTTNHLRRRTALPLQARPTLGVPARRLPFPD